MYQLFDLKNSFGLNVEIEDDPKIKHDIKLNEQVISDTKVVEGDSKHI